jgi:hypothetical protein
VTSGARSIRHSPQRRNRTSDTGRIRAVLLTTELPAVGLHGRTRTCATRLRKPALCPVELRGDWSGRRDLHPPPRRWQRRVLLAELRPHGHCGRSRTPASAVWVRRSAVELRGRVPDWCARRGSNPHGLAATRLSTWRVCLFRHERRRYAPLLLPVDDSNVALRGSEPRVLPLHQPGP